MTLATGCSWQRIASNGTTSSGIVNNAAATWSGNGNLSNWATGRFTNSATGSLDIQTDANFSSGTADSVFKRPFSFPVAPPTRRPTRLSRCLKVAEIR